eukprot:67143-Pleurochrysis_carterae.AAC.1
MASAARTAEPQTPATSPWPSSGSPHVERTDIASAARSPGRFASPVVLNACVFVLALIIGWPHSLRASPV